jgi:hypothetical protein
MKTHPALIACVIAMMACRGGPKEKAASMGPVPDPPYMGQPAPGTTPEKFAPGIVSTDAIELNGVFTPDGREFFFTRQLDGVDTMHHSIFENGKWSDPKPLLVYPKKERAVAVDMSVSPGGRSLYFMGQFPSEEKPSSDIWVSTRSDSKNGWSTAQKIPPPISTAAEEIYPVIVGDRSLYFVSNRADGKHHQLYRAQRNADGSFDPPAQVGPPIANAEFGTGDTYVAPDESYLVFASRRPPSQGGADLFVSFGRKDGSWSEPASLGPAVNTADYEFCPMVTPDGKYLFFSRRVGATWETTTAGDVYWVSTRVLEPLRRQPS